MLHNAAMISWTASGAAACLLVALSGCGGGAAQGRTGFDTDFTRIAPTGYVDMSLDFSNPTKRPVTLQGRLVARDASDAEMPDVTVTTAFGTEAGRAVVMPGGSVDFVQLQGARAGDVRDVTFELTTSAVLDVPVASAPVGVTSIDAQGQELDYDMFAEQIRQENPNAAPVHVRVVLMVLRASETGVPQQATLVRDVTAVDVPPSGGTTIELDPTTKNVLREQGGTGFVTLRAVPAP